MIVLGIVLGLVLGLLAGGKITRLIDVHLRWIGLIFLALVLRYGTQLAIADGNQLVESLRLPLYAAAFLLLLAGLWPNRNQPGILAVIVGAAANGLAIVINGGYMPVWGPSLAAAQMGTGDLSVNFVLLPTEIGSQFFRMAGPIADLIPVPIPYLNNVSSIGDAFIAAGLAWFVFAYLVRANDAAQPAEVSLGPDAQVVVDSGIGIERPVVLGGGAGPGLSSPFGPQTPYGPRGRIRGHPYVRLAHDPRFAAYWLAQTISLFGDRLHQVAIGVLVYAVTNSPLATGLVFLAATLPNVVLGPIAGAFVDRWEHKRVMIASDLIRAALVLAVPFAADSNIYLVYPLVFLITSVSLFFRPAKVAILPRIVKEDDIMAASSATWTADNLADVIGFPLAGLFVGFLGVAASDLTLAFVADSASYVLSAALLATITIAPLVRVIVPTAASATRVFIGQVSDGWRFLRTKPALIQNTLISAVAQMSVGVTLALMVVFARDGLDGSVIPYPENFAAIETAIGVGSLVGGIAVGAIGNRLRKGWLVVSGFMLMGLSFVVIGLTTNVVVAIVAATIAGVANLVYIIPTQTIFIEITPNELMGRVVAFRSSLVYGSMTLAMAISGIAAESVPVGIVIAAFGGLTLIGGLIGALLPAVRNPNTVRAQPEAAQPALQ